MTWTLHPQLVAASHARIGEASPHTSCSIELIASDRTDQDARFGRPLAHDHVIRPAAVARGPQFYGAALLIR